MTRPSRIVLAIGCALGLAAGGRVLAQTTTVGEAAAALAHATTDWLASLDDGQRGRARYDFRDDERFDLRLAPLFLEGLKRDDMTEAQWDGVRGMLGTVLSDRGRAKVETIITLEDEVLVRDGRSFLGGLWGRFIHGQQRYFVAIFGEPRPEAPWGLRLDGHHLSINLTSAPFRGLSVTPLFLGAEPREVPEGWERAGLRALGEEEDRARALWLALDDQQRGVARLELELASGPAGANRKLFLGEGERISRAEPVGVAHGDMTEEQQGLLDALIEVWLGNFVQAIADAERRAIDADGRDEIFFAAAGIETAGAPSYYRIQGPGFLIEWDDTMEAADHVHTVFRRFDSDFGRDLLAEHWEAEHGGVRVAFLRRGRLE